MPRQRYEVWGVDGSLTLMAGDAIPGARASGLIEPEATKLYDIIADTWEEAMAVHHIKQGWEPYRPAGEAIACSHECGGMVYPDGSGMCPNCG